MDIRRISALIKKSEGIKLDFKEKIELSTESAKKELAKDVCAIANSRGGRGYIIIGIRDKTKEILGMDKDSIHEEQLQQVISSRCEPPIPVNYETVEIDGKTIGIINIYDGNQKPYQLRDNGAFYIRRGSTTDTMRKFEILSTMEENHNFNAELFPILNSSVEDFDIELVDKYFSNHNIKVTDENRLYLMKATSILVQNKESNDYCGSLGGLLIFSKINYMFVPHNMVRIINKISNKEPRVIAIQGNLQGILDQCEEKLNNIFPKQYPIKAVYEGIKNAILYRDYNAAHKIIEVVISQNSTTITSPGILMKEKKLENLKYIRRNMWIYEKLLTLDNSSREALASTGFNRMKKAFKAYGRVDFINSIENDYFKVIYPGVKAVNPRQ
ncbi:helix-turn-helix domain-containing protein [Clostridium cellulovorans]|uniref:Putative transcriptional regulator n=1 Tax=Clostridium cellulovorans (strain ATCC 35296 / DSM 3052 / OCM 3 / 743B) TaxID=573061 RepID=D9SRS3_CLOC7|nr:RNA-binding domain-containing protein [Clostridium cellulovorans]ADL50440.1 putative transcriptional regulator [Clostridium cellulovorans 743B]